MIAPVSRLKKAEIVWLGSNNCKHGHTYLSHYQCYLKENPDQHRLGYFDIETLNFNAGHGFMLCYCILDAKSGRIYESHITKKDHSSKVLDRNVVQKCVKDLGNFDKVVGFYSTKFDLPYVRSRAIHHGVDFPGYGELKHEDVYYIIKNKFKFGRNSQEAACRQIFGEATEKDHVDAATWLDAAVYGNTTAMGRVVEHCKKDVRDLKKLHEAVGKFRRPSDLSA